MRVLSKIREEFSFLRGNILVLVVSWILMNVSGGIPSTYYPLYVLGLGGTPFTLGLIGFVSFLAMALVQFPGGYLADKHGRRGLIVTMTFGVALSYVSFAVAPFWHFILIGAIIQNLCLIYQPALVAIEHDSIPPEQRGMGFSTIMLINNLAAMLSPVIAGVLYLHFGLDTSVRIGYLIVTSFFFAAALVRLKLTETLHTDNNENLSFNAVLKAYPKAVKEGLSVWGLLPRSMFFLFLSDAISSFVFVMSGPYLLVYAIDVLGIKEFEWAILISWLTAVTLLSALPSGKLADRIGRKKPLLVSWILLAPFTLLFLYGDLFRLFVAYLLLGTSNTLFMAGYSSLQADLVPRELRGKVVGCSHFIEYILMGSGELIGGFLYQFVSPTFPLLLGVIVTIPCILMTLFLVHEPKTREV